MLQNFIKAFCLGIIEGITEWLPVSSTGHMILFDDIFTLSGRNEFKEVFFVVIQMGAICAVIVSFFKKLVPHNKASVKGVIKRWEKIIVASIPAAVIGILINDKADVLIVGEKRSLIVAICLIFYGVLFILTEKIKKEPKIKSESEIDLKTALFIGFFQVLSIIPGTSRSGSTILGAVILGVTRPAAAEFSFFMSVPAMAGASAVKLIKFIGGGLFLTFDEIIILLVGCAVSYIISVMTINFLTDFVKSHSFKAFGYYRIILGGIILAMMINQ